MMQPIHDIVFNALARPRMRRAVMVRVYGHFAMSLVRHAAFMHGFTVMVLGGALAQLITPSALFKNIMDTRFGDVPHQVVNILVQAPLIKTVVLASFVLLTLLSVRHIAAIPALFTPALRRA